MRIETGIPLPPQIQKTVKRDYSSIQVGMSIFVETISEKQSIFNSIRRRHPDWQVTARQVEGGYRIWRIA